jgi:hypothetical protein
MRILTPVIAIAFLLHAGASAQDSKPSEPTPTITSRAELVLLPTLVREKSGAPISGLAQTDFTLLENGAERKIAVFEEIKTTAVRSHGRTLDAHLKPETLQQIRSSGITYRDALDLPPGQYTVRFVVRDNLSGRMGSVAAPLTVPDQ